NTVRSPSGEFLKGFLQILGNERRIARPASLFRKIEYLIFQCSPDIVGMSALLTTTTKSIPATLKALEEAGLRDSVKVMIGGAPITEEYAMKIGADGFAADAGGAARAARALIDAG
ncbi:MAG: cobalamin-dependent protein, partial [Anaerolineae bacterium]